MRVLLLAGACLLSAILPVAQASAAPPDEPATKPEPEASAAASAVEQAVPHQRAIPFDGGTLAYTVTPGTLTLRNDEGEAIASMFYTSYTVAPAKGGKPRPVTFLYNGGPGSSSMWLHLGSYGPLKLRVGAPGTAATGTGQLLPNPDTILDRTDLVFLDAIGTGLSRPLGKATGKEFWGVDGDLDAFARGIERWLAVTKRWASPKFLLGESYGTTRTVGLAFLLGERGVRLAGVTVMSTVLDIPQLFDPTSDQAQINILPTFAATAWYHHRLADRPATLDEQVARARAFAAGPYAAALAQGDRLPATERERLATSMAALIGVSPAFLLRADLRPGPDGFRAELLRDQRRTVGRLDSRFDGIATDANAEAPEFDAANEALSGAFVAALNNYLFNDLGMPTKLAYRPNFYPAIGANWDWRHKAPGGGRQLAVNTAVDLAQAMRQNPQLKLLSLNGYYDMATPFAGADSDLAHLGLDPTLRGNVTYRYYPSGHMIYIDPGSARQLRADLDRFYDDALR